MEFVEAVSGNGEADPWIAGARGYLACVVGGFLRRGSSRTGHPLRAIARSDASVYVGGGGWAENMPILLRVRDGSVTPLISAGGNRVIVGLALINDELWIAEMRSDDQA